MLLSLSSGYRYPPFKQLGNGYLGESAERNKRDTRRPESARVTRASCSTTASSLLRYATRVSLACARSLFRPLLPSACYAGYATLI